MLPSDPQTNLDVRRVFATLWWVSLLRGALMVIFGVIVLVWPEPALVAFVWLFGIYAILDGVASLAHVWRTRSHIGMGVGLGIVSLLAGLVALIWPGVTAVVALFIVAAWLLVLGLIQVAAGVVVRAVPGSGWGWIVGSGVLTMLLGFFLFGAPSSGILALLVLMGVMLIASGLVLMVAAIFARRFVTRV